MKDCKVCFLKHETCRLSLESWLVLVYTWTAINTFWTSPACPDSVICAGLSSALQIRVRT